MKNKLLILWLFVLTLCSITYVNADFNKEQEDKLNKINLEIVEFKKSYKQEIYNDYEYKIKNLSEEELKNKLKNLEKLIKKHRKDSNYELKNLNRLKLEVIYSIFEDELLSKMWIEKTKDLILY